MNDEVDLPELESISLSKYAFAGDDYAENTSEFIMKSVNEKMQWWLEIPNIKLFKGDGYNLNCISRVELDGMMVVRYTIQKSQH